MIKLRFIISMLFAALLFTTCNDEQSATPPIFGGFKVEPSAVHPGEKIKITAVQVQKGHYLYGAKHRWKLVIPVESEDGPTQTTISYDTPTEEIISSYDDPAWETTIPSNAIIGGHISGTFTGTWNNAADGGLRSYTGGTIEGCIGTITSSISTLYSQANGSFTLTIQ